MATIITAPTDPLYSYFYGDIDVFPPLSSDSGTGSVYLRNSTSSFLVSGNTNLNQTYINTNNGQFNIDGTNNIVANMTSAIQLTATVASNFTTTAGTLTLSATATDANGKVNISAAGLGTDSVLISASNATSGQVHITSAGAAAGSVLIDATNAAGQVLLQSAGTGATAIKLNSTAGGIDLSATGLVNITTSNTTNGITIGTGTATVPITIGTTGSLTTIQGDLLVKGSTTTVNSITLTFDDNVVILNAGNAVSGFNAGLSIRRYQIPQGTTTANPAGSVIDTIGPIQEQGAFQTGSATPGTLVLSAFASDTNDWYKGWWLVVTSGTGANQVVRIKSYVGSTKTATIYVAADNVTPPPGSTTEVTFSDGVDMTVAPAAADTYSLYNSAYPATYYNEPTAKWNFSTIANIEDGITATSIQQPQDIESGSVSIRGKTYYNVSGSASGTTITFTLLNHGLSIGNLIRVDNTDDFSVDFTSATPYAVVSVPTANTFTITVGATTTSSAPSSATLYFYTSSVISANVIQAFDPEYPISIPGISVYQDIVIPDVSTATFLLSLTSTFGSYLLLVSDISGTGATGIFACTNNGSGSTPSRIASTKNATTAARISANWASATQIGIFHMPAAGTAVTSYTYRCRIMSCI